MKASLEELGPAIAGKKPSSVPAFAERETLSKQIEEAASE